MKAIVQPLDNNKYYYTKIAIYNDEDKEIGLIQVKIDPDSFKLEDISPRENVPYSEVWDISWNHIETKNSYNVAKMITAVINVDHIIKQDGG